MNLSDQEHANLSEAATLLAELLVASIDGKYASKARRPARGDTRKQISLNQVDKYGKEIKRKESKASSPPPEFPL